MTSHTQYYGDEHHNRFNFVSLNHSIEIDYYPKKNSQCGITHRFKMNHHPPTILHHLTTKNKNKKNLMATSVTSIREYKSKQTTG